MKQIVSRLAAAALAAALALTMMPADGAEAAEKLKTPTGVKLSTSKVKGDKYECGLKVSWSGVSGASMYKIRLQYRYADQSNYYNQSNDFYADGRDTSHYCAVTKQLKDMYYKAEVTAIGSSAEKDTNESKPSNAVKVSKNKDIHSSSDKICTLYYDDNCGYASWGKDSYGYQRDKKGKNVTLKKGPSRKGYKFLYWIDKSGKKYNAGSKYKLKKNYDELYAIWQVGNTEVKPGSGQTLDKPAEVKLSAKAISEDAMASSNVRFHASWSRVEGAYGYLLYLDTQLSDPVTDNDMNGYYYYKNLYNPYVVIGEYTTSYDFEDYLYEDGPYYLAVRPITASELKKFTDGYTGKNYKVSNPVSVNQVKLYNNYRETMTRKVLSPEAIKFNAKSNTVTGFLAIKPSGKKVSYWWDSDTRQKVKSGDTLEGKHSLYPIWR